MGKTRSVLSVAQTVQRICREHLGIDVGIRTGPKGESAQRPFQLNLARAHALGYVPQEAMEQETVRFLELLRNG